MYMGVWELKTRARGNSANGKLYLATDISTLQVRGWQLWHRQNCSGGVLLGLELTGENTSVHQGREGGSR